MGIFLYSCTAHVHHHFPRLSISSSEASSALSSGMGKSEFSFLIPLVKDNTKDMGTRLQVVRIRRYSQPTVSKN